MVDDDPQMLRYATRSRRGLRAAGHGRPGGPLRLRGDALSASPERASWTGRRPQPVGGVWSIVGKSQSGRACAEPASRPSAPRSGGGAKRRALTSVSTRARCWLDDAAVDHNILRSTRVQFLSVPRARQHAHGLVLLDLGTSRRRRHRVDGAGSARSTSARQPASIGLHPLRMPLRSPRRAHPVEQFLDLPRQMVPLTPAAHRAMLSRPPRLPQQATHRVPQQADVRRIMHVRLDNERVTPPA